MYYTELFALVLVLVFAQSAPIQDHEAKSNHPQSMELWKVQHNSSCPIVEAVDEDPDRVPRRIKMYKCDTDPQPVCRELERRLHHKHAPVCCGAHHMEYYTQCVQVTDKVTVREYRDGVLGAPYSMDVYIGCSCMIFQHGDSKDVH